jgi:hypothetical protein
MDSEYRFDEKLSHTIRCAGKDRPIGNNRTLVGAILMPLSFKKQLFKELDAFFEERGFKRHSDRFYGDRYDRPIAGGRHSLAIASHVRKPVVVLDAAFAGIRLEAIEEEVFRFEEKNELVSERDALQRNTIGLRLAANELFNITSNRYTIGTERDCSIIAEKYAQAMLERAERFWKEFSSSDAILAKLSDVPGKARDYAGTDIFSSERAVVLAKQLHGKDSAIKLADQIIARLPESAKRDLSSWLQRAEREWSGA